MTKLHKILVATLIALVASDGCAINGYNTSNIVSGNLEYQGASANYLTICRIRKNIQLYLGKSVKVHAIFETDSSTYAYLRDANKNDSKCSGMHTILMGRTSEKRMADVTSFYSAIDKYCEHQKMRLCVVSVSLDGEGKLKRGKRGLYIYMEKIFNYRFEK